MPTKLCAVLIVACLSSFASADDFKSDLISVKVQGSGPDMILIPGFACSADVWLEVVREFKPRLRLHVVQIAGFAGSPPAKGEPDKYLAAIRDEVARYIKTKHVKNPVLLGHSMGGLVSLMVSSKEPSTVGHVIIVDALPLFSLIFNPLATTEQSLPFARAFETQVLNMDDMQFEKQAKSSAARLTKKEARADLLVKWSKASDRKVYARIFREVMAYDARPGLDAITCPITVLFAYDKAMGVSKKHVTSLYENAYANAEDVRFQCVSDSFHFIMWDQPEVFMKALDSALKER